MPIPQKGETQKEYIDRCMSEVVGEGKDKDQAYAICQSKWDNRKFNKLMEAAGINKLDPEDEDEESEGWDTIPKK